jgi:glycerol-3-phosphate acyltransferase PlsY
MIVVWKLVVSFLIGSIPFAKIAMLGTGIDITQVGSKNPGFLNVSRFASKWRAAITLIGDLFKGYIALSLLARSETSEASMWMIGIAAVMGHCWSPFLRFDGGKGVATTFGVLLFLKPPVTFACLPLYPLLRVIGSKMGWSQRGAIASLSTAFLITIVVTLLDGLEQGLFACVMLAIVVVRHLPNLREIISGPHCASSNEPKSSAPNAQGTRIHPRSGVGS